MGEGGDASEQRREMAFSGFTEKRAMGRRGGKSRTLPRHPEPNEAVVWIVVFDESCRAQALDNLLR
jgi:hypothetical protein